MNHEWQKAEKGIVCGKVETSIGNKGVSCKKEAI